MLDDKPIIAVDWGTTNRRAFAIAGDGGVRDRYSDGLGVLSVEPGHFEEAIAGLRARLGAAPVVAAGMIGSNRGWIDLPYVDCPAGFDALAADARRLDGDVTVVPGLRHVEGAEADVMRGEEVQLLGAIAAGLVPPDASACHPGTHAKWVKLRSGRIVSFRTVMTGELFALLRTHSILANQLQAAVVPGPPFAAGVRRSLDRGDITADLFRVRALGLVGTLADEDAAAYASGLLIGADIRAGTGFVGEDGPVALIGDPMLTALYAAALAEAARDCTEIDGELAFVAGIRALVEILS